MSIRRERRIVGDVVKEGRRKWRIEKENMKDVTIRRVSDHWIRDIGEV